MTKDPEYLLIDRILDGEQAVYANLVNQYKKYVFTISYRILQNHMDAEEASQDTFVKAFRGLRSFSRQSKFSTWLYRIAFNTAISFKRKHRVQFQSIEHTARHAREDENLPEKQDKKRYIDQALAKLNEADRTALTLFYLQEFSLEEIAEITNIPVNTTKVRIHRARLRLAEALKNILNQEALIL